MKKDSVRDSKIKKIADYLKSKDMSIEKITQDANFFKVFDDKESYSKGEIKKLCSFFNTLSINDILDDSVTLLEDISSYGLKRQTEKVRYLSNYLETEKGLSLYRALSLSETKVSRVLDGCVLPSNRFLAMLADYFFIDISYLKDDKKELPEYNKLAIDEELAAIQTNDFKVHAEKNKHKHVVRRSWRILSHAKRVRLVCTSLAIIIPLALFIGYCSFTEIADRVETTASYSNDAMDEEAQQIAANLPNSDHFVAVNIGSEVYSISNITTTTYEVKMSLWFDFDQLELHKALSVLNSTIGKYDTDIKALAGWSDDYYKLDRVGYDALNEVFYGEPDGVPDFVEVDFTKANLNTYSATSVDLSPIYYEETSCYPGQASSNNYTENTNMFSMERGDFVPDTVSYDYITPYTVEENSEKDYRLFQKCTFSATIKKKFDCPRYPLDSAQFHIYVEPKFTTDYIRYNATDSVDLRSTADRNISLFGTAEDIKYVTGLNGAFSVTSGYKLISSDTVKSNIARLDYSGTQVSDTEYQDCKTHFEFVVRVNREGISLFLQAFANLFAVVVWITIAFYDQAYNGNDSIGMLGTGLFGVISSMLVGISMINDANIFSLITMINIFTLAVIMLMTFEAVISKRAIIKKDRAATAYNTVKLRLLFFSLVTATVIMFVCLPIISYIIF